MRFLIQIIKQSPTDKTELKREWQATPFSQFQYKISLLQNDLGVFNLTILCHFQYINSFIQLTYRNLFTIGQLFL